MEEDKQSHEKKPLVLFIDDEVEILNSLKRQFSIQTSFEAIFEADPTKVIQLIQENPVEIIVADIVMPDIDGITLLAQVKEKFPKIIRILLTAHGDMDTTVRALNEADVFGFITKPWEKSYLFGHLEMAARVYREEDLKPKILISLPLVIYATWKDNDGVTIITKIKSKQEQIAKINIYKGFMGAASLYGLENRFEETSFTLPIDEMGSQIRCYLSKGTGDDEASGIFVLSHVLSKEVEAKMDDFIETHKQISSKDVSNLQIEIQRLLYS